MNDTSIHYLEDMCGACLYTSSPDYYILLPLLLLLLTVRGLLSVVTRSSPPSDLISSLPLFLPVCNRALQELREIHSRQQRQKQRELEGDTHTLTHTHPHMHTPIERKSAELQHSR